MNDVLPESPIAHRQLDVLLVEDSLPDAELSLRELQKAGFEVTIDVVQTPEEFDERIHARSYDIILADYNLPRWTGMEALKQLQRQGRDVPFILVTGSLGEETAVECIKQGATDYVLKDRLVRLPVAVHRALEKKALREQRKRAEKQLHLQATVLEATANAILIADRDGTIIWVNPAFTLLTGYTPQEVIGKNPSILKSDKQDRSFYENLWATILAGKVWHGEITNRRKDGSLYTEDQTITPVRDESGAISHFIGIKLDITERKRMEVALRDSEARFRTLAESSPVGIFRTDADGRCIFVNERGCEIIGLTPEAATGYGWAQAVHPDDRERVLGEWNMAVRQNLPFRSEYRFQRPHGSITWVFGQAMAERGHAGEIISYVGTITDITELKRAEEELKAAQLQLIQSAKLESVGRLAAGVAHEVKNPLAIIQQGVGYLAKKMVGPDVETTALVLQKMDNAVRRADRVIRGLLDFSASSALEMEPADLNAAVEESLLLVKHELVKTRVTVVKGLVEHLPALKMDRHKIEQVFVNLFINAIQAMPEGGTLTIKTGTRSLDEIGSDFGRWNAGPFQSARLRRNSVVVVQVEDTGAGIPEDKLDRIFDPFFTTKQPNQGTGLGLSVARNIMELHGGTIRISNRREGGVRVTLLFKVEGGDTDEKEADPAH